MGFRSLTVATLILGLVCFAGQAQADVWNYLPNVVMSGHSECPTDDPVCQLTCELLKFEDGYSDPEVEFNPLKVVLPAPGDGDGFMGHWTICLPI